MEGTCFIADHRGTVPIGWSFVISIIIEISAPRPSNLQTNSLTAIVCIIRIVEMLSFVDMDAIIFVLDDIFIHFIGFTLTY